LRWRRRRYLWRAFRARHDLSHIVDKASTIRPNDILCFAVVRNEAVRLPYFLFHYRALGVQHFLIIDNDSTDDTKDLLTKQKDVSLWSTKASYRNSRYGVDWVTWLLMRYGHGHWCLTVDADELLTYPFDDSHDLGALTDKLTTIGARSFGALMLDLYPYGPVGDTHYEPGQDPRACLDWFDPPNYWFIDQPWLNNRLVRGGPRVRTFFSAEPHRAPTMNKTPLVFWHWRYAFINSTHVILPKSLNQRFQDADSAVPSGVLLHTKFLNVIVDKSKEEKQRKQHFANSDLYDVYYDALASNPNLWTNDSVQLSDWRQLVALGLMRQGAWHMNEKEHS
jgi:glycosyltransferase involved in cell wall biosynthesis